MFVIKLAVAMVLAGGVQRVDSSATKIRGNSHSYYVINSSILNMFIAMYCIVTAQVKLLKLLVYGQCSMLLFVAVHAFTAFGSLVQKAH